MTISVTCSCGGQFAAQPHLAGKTVRCPNCQQPLHVPTGASHQPLAPIVNPFSDSAAPVHAEPVQAELVQAELVPPVVAPNNPPIPHSQDPFGGRASVAGPSGQSQVVPSYAPQPTAKFEPGYGQPPQKSYATVLVICAVLFGVLGCMFVAGVGVYQFIKEIDGLNFADFADSQPIPVQAEDYASARTGFKTDLTIKGGAPQEWDPLVTPYGAVELAYQSDGHAQRAFVDPPPADGKPRPGVIFLHGGFAWGDGDWEMSQPYRDQGYVVMSPVLRGENGQPGFFSLYYDEVDDVLAATSAFAALPYVDESQLYIAGHSAGGTLATLAAMASDRFLAMASFSGTMNQRNAWDSELLVYNGVEERESLMRSPEAFAKSFKCPARLYYGRLEADWFEAETKRTEATAKSAGLDVKSAVVYGDHMSSVQPAMLKSISFFRQVGLSKGNLVLPNPTASPRTSPPSVSPTSVSPPDVSPPNIPVPTRPTPDELTPDLPSFSPPFTPPDFNTPPRPALPAGPRGMHQGVVTFEVVGYSGRLPQRSSAIHALIRIPWADKARIAIDEDAGVITVPVRRGPSMSTKEAGEALQAAGFDIGKVTFKPNDE